MQFMVKWRLNLGMDDTGFYENTASETAAINSWAVAFFEGTLKAW